MWCEAANAITQSKSTAFIISLLCETEDICAKYFGQDYDLRIGFPSMTARRILVERFLHHSVPADVKVRPWLILFLIILSRPHVESPHPVWQRCQRPFPFRFWFLRCKCGNLIADGFLQIMMMTTSCLGSFSVRETAALSVSLTAAAVGPPFRPNSRTACCRCHRHRTAAAAILQTDCERQEGLQTLDLEVAEVQRLAAEPHSLAVAAR